MHELIKRVGTLFTQNAFLLFFNVNVLDGRV